MSVWRPSLEEVDMYCSIHSCKHLCKVAFLFMPCLMAVLRKLIPGVLCR